MTVDFDSFDQSDLNAFVQTKCDARNDLRLNIAIMMGTEYYVNGGLAAYLSDLALYEERKARASPPSMEVFLYGETTQCPIARNPLPSGQSWPPRIEAHHIGRDGFGSTGDLDRIIGSRHPMEWSGYTRYSGLPEGVDPVGSIVQYLLSTRHLGHESPAPLNTTFEWLNMIASLITVKDN